MALTRRAFRKLRILNGILDVMVVASMAYFLDNLLEGYYTGVLGLMGLAFGLLIALTGTVLSVATRRI